MLRLLLIACFLTAQAYGADLAPALTPALSPALRGPHSEIPVESVGTSGQAQTPTSVSVGARSSAPENVSPTTLIPLSPFIPEPDSGFEDFAVTSVISLPFTALWSLLGSMLVTSLWQQKFPPELGDQELIGAASTALGASLTIGLISVNWGGSKKK